jgi:general secretion pathway protein F
MVGISDMLTGLWWLWLILIAVIAFLISLIRKGGKIADWWNEKLLKIPVLGELLILTEISRFLRTLAVLIQNHVHLLSTMQIAVNVIINPQISKTFSAVTPELKGGAKLSAALGKSAFVPKHALQMLSIGEESGNMGGMLDQVAQHYEELLKTKIKRLLALFEPVVILFLAAVIMSVVLSIFLAILEMQNM